MVLSITEVLRHGKSGKGNSHSCARRLVHLTEAKCSLVENAGFFHLVIEVVALAGAFADAGENGNAAVLGGYVIDKLLNKNGFAYARAAEKADFTALGVGANKVDDLDAGFKNLRLGFLFCKGRCGLVNGHFLYALGIHFHTVDRLAKHVDHSSECNFAHRNLYGFTGIHTVLTSFKSIGGIHCDAANNVVAHMLSNLNNKTGTCVVDFDCVVQLRKVAFLESYINDRADNLNNFSYIAHEFVFLLNYLRSL